MRPPWSERLRPTPPPDPGAPLLEVEDLTVRHGEIVAVRGLSFTLREGEVLALLGPNGAGKSSTLRALSGLLHAAEGSVRFQGRRIDRMSPEAIVRLGMTHVPEGRGIFPDLTVRENLRMPTRGLSREALEAALERVHGHFPRLVERASQPAGTLSGGEQQQLAIGRALMVQPRLLLLDEMSLGLAPTVVEQLFEILARIHAGGMAVLLVEQYVGPALAAADTAIVMEKGRVRVSGPAGQLARDVTVVQASYLGAAGAGAEKPALVGSAFREPLGVELSPEQIRRLGELAARRGMTAEQVGQEAIERMLTMAGRGAQGGGPPG
ncbi:MAG: branched-chain amino acid transport system ATP-binding protein [Chloroflexota bacterium]|nr:branched-chain amino acid transport system ATP-binding protein [Chloroflexota bacterium]